MLWLYVNWCNYWRRRSYLWTMKYVCKHYIIYITTSPHSYSGESLGATQRKRLTFCIHSKNKFILLFLQWIAYCSFNEFCPAFDKKVIYLAWSFWESPNNKILISLRKLWWCKIFKRTVLCSIYKRQFKRKWEASSLINKGNNKITELRTILQRESQNS